MFHERDTPPPAPDYSDKIAKIEAELNSAKGKEGEAANAAKQAKEQAEQ